MHKISQRNLIERRNFYCTKEAKKNLMNEGKMNEYIFLHYSFFNYHIVAKKRETFLFCSFFSSLSEIKKFIPIILIKKCQIKTRHRI